MQSATRRNGGFLGIAGVLGACALAAFGFSSQARAQPAVYARVRGLPNPYRLVKDWPTLPATMNGGHWGEVSRVQLDAAGNVWVFHRCFASEPPGSAVCLGAYKDFPPLLKFDPSGKLLASLGAGLFVYPHGFTIDGDGYLWTTDVNDKAAVLGLPARNAEGVIMGQDVLKLDPTNGKVLMTLGMEGVTGNGSNTFDMPPGVAVAANGNVFVTDGHRRNELKTGRVVEFDRTGTFIRTWGRLGSEPGNFNDPHDIAIGGSESHVYVADRQNKRVQVFDQDGQFLAAWPQFGEVNSVFVSKDDTIYAGTGFADPDAAKGEVRGILVGSAKDGSLKAFIPDPVDLNTVVRGTAASGITADAEGTIYAADVGSHNLRKYVLQDRPR